MSTPTAKDLLAQADRMMRQRTPEELPVLTDLVVEEIEIHSVAEPGSPQRPAAATAVPARSVSAPASASAPISAPASAPVSAPVTARTALPGAAVANAAIAAGMPTPAAQRPLPKLPPGPAPAQPPATARSAGNPRQDDAFGFRPRMPYDAPAPTPIGAAPTTTTAANSLRDQFNAQLLAKLEELQHSVFSQVMQQLELHAAGALKTHLRQTLEPALMDIARDIAEQVAEDTSVQVREVVSKAVDSEIARLREQLAKRRSDPPRS
jgi:hypothetical protein